MGKTARTLINQLLKGKPSQWVTDALHLMLGLAVATDLVLFGLFLLRAGAWLRLIR